MNYVTFNFLEALLNNNFLTFNNYLPVFKKNEILNLCEFSVEINLLSEFFYYNKDIYATTFILLAEIYYQRYCLNERNL